MEKSIVRYNLRFRNQSGISTHVWGSKDPDAVLEKAKLVASDPDYGDGYYVARVTTTEWSVEAFEAYRKLAKELHIP